MYSQCSLYAGVLKLFKEVNKSIITYLPGAPDLSSLSYGFIVFTTFSLPPKFPDLPNNGSRFFLDNYVHYFFILNILLLFLLCYRH